MFPPQACLAAHNRPIRLTSERLIRCFSGFAVQVGPEELPSWKPTSRLRGPGTLSVCPVLVLHPGQIFPAFESVIQNALVDEGDAQG